MSGFTKLIWNNLKNKWIEIEKKMIDMNSNWIKLNKFNKNQTKHFVNLKFQSKIRTQKKMSIQNRIRMIRVMRWTYFDTTSGLFVDWISEFLFGNRHCLKNYWLKLNNCVILTRFSLQGSHWQWKSDPETNKSPQHIPKLHVVINLTLSNIFLMYID